MGLRGSILGSVLSGIGSTCCKGILFIGRTRLLGLGGFWTWLVVGLLDMGPCIFWFVELRRLGSDGALMVSVGIGLDCLGCISADLCSRKEFRGGPLLDYPGFMQLLVSSHVRDGDKARLRGIL